MATGSRTLVVRRLVVLLSLTVWSGCPSTDPVCCTRDADCETYSKCFEGQCSLTCQTSDQCPVGQDCLLTGVCAAENRGNSQCGFDPVQPFEIDAGVTRATDGGATDTDDGGAAPRDGGVSDGGLVLDGGTSCVPDMNEPNDGVEEATLAPESNQELSICEGGDQDYFKFELDAGNTVQVTISFSHAEADLDLKLVRNEQVVAISQTAADQETISFTASSEGVYHLIVYAFMNSDGAPYEIDFDFAMPTGCVDDDYEENDNLSEAQVFQFPFNVDAVACPNDADFFPFLLQGGFETVIYLEPPPNVFFPGFSAAIYDAETNEQLEAIFSSETVVTLPNQSAEFFIVVNNVTDTPIPYSLKLEFE